MRYGLIEGVEDFGNCRSGRARRAITAEFQSALRNLHSSFGFCFFI
ncbi:hypothetical protein BSIN_3899 [Burkholderia singularis]|uniref:Uncharacterized protein n=1 Tax=Burkholderia singularis TaxID=1503053 RepID=A0A238H6Q3_9BURK|nr:hypothetical protein BSIN_3899 [Burkholderia singularis]